MDGSPDRFRPLFEQANDAIALVEFRDSRPVIKEVNGKFQEYFQPEGMDVVGRDLDEVVAADAQTDEARTLTRRVHAGELIRKELTRQTVDGPRDFFWQVIPVDEPELEAADSAFAIYTDITQRVRQKRELEQSEERYHRLLATAPTPILIYSYAGEIVYANAAALDFLGADDRDEVVGLAAEEFIESTSIADLESRSEQFIELGKSVPPTEQTFFDLDGEEKHVIVASASVTYDGEPAIQMVATDITKLKARGDQLHRYETLVEVSGDPMYMLDEDGYFTYVNEAMVEITGREKEAIQGEHGSIVMEEEDMAKSEELIRSLLSDGKRRGTFELQLVTAEGDRIPSENHMSLLYDDGDFIGTVGVLRDISTRLEREKRLQRERDRLDEFAGFVSHDLRNPLNVAAGRLQLAMQECESDHLEAVDRAIDRMETLIDDMLSLARAGKTVGGTETIELAELIDSCWRNVETESAELVVETEMAIMADRTRLQQLFENLIRNAVEHVGADIEFTVGDLPDGFYVEDDGPGIPPDKRQKVLDAGYSSAYEGTGFGLRIVRDIAEAHDWSFEVTEGSAGGARFEFSDVHMD